MLTKRARARGGFTLVEMLVVIAIIALLAAILFPTVSGAKKKARQAACMSRLQAIGQAVKMYHLDHKKYPQTLSDLQKYLDFQTAGTTLTTGRDKLIDGEDLRKPNAPTDAYSSYGGFGVGTQIVSPDPAGDCGAPAVNDHPENCPRQTGGTYFGAFNPDAPNASNAFPATMQLAWNYWGYAPDGFALCRTNAAPCGNPFQSPLYQYQAYVAGLIATAPTLPAGISKWANYPALANKNAPENTIITHCVFQRSSWGTNNGTLWDGNTGDLILRLDGTVRWVKLADMASKWVAQTE